MDRDAVETNSGDARDCPTALDLDHLISEELPPAEAARIAEHVAQCARCQPKVEQRRAHFGAFPEVSETRLLESLKLRWEAAESTRRKRIGLRRYAIGGTAVFAAAAAAAAAAIILFARSGVEGPTSEDGTARGGVRSKGGLGLHVYKWSGQRSILATDGERFSPGDRLRFVVDLPRPGHVNILGVESSGKMYVAWPSETSESTLRGAGKEQALPGAMELDDSRGREMIHLVACPTSVGAPASVCRTAGAGGAPSCPLYCAIVSFSINKP